MNTWMDRLRRHENWWFPVLVFLALFCAIRVPLMVDEPWYMHWIGSRGHLLNVLQYEGKEPFPLWIARIFVHGLHCHTILTARLGSMVFGSISALLLLKIARTKGISISFTMLCLFSSAYFVFYSRIYMYEIYVIFASWLLLYSALLLEKNGKQAYLGLFFGAFIGCMTKLSFLSTLIAMPLVMVANLTSQGPFLNVIQRNYRKLILGVGCAILGALASLLCIIIPGYWGTHEHFRKFISHDLKDVLKPSIFLDFQSGWSILWQDMGPGIIVGFFGAVAWAFTHKRYALALCSLVAFAVVFKMSTALPLWLWSRYMIAVYPLTLVLLFVLLSDSAFAQIRKIGILSITILQLWPIARTTAPLMFNLKYVHWTSDEINQHINGTALYGMFDFEDKVLDEAKSHQIRLRCKGPPGLYDAMTFCFDMLTAHREVFHNGLPLEELTFIKTFENDISIGDPHVLKVFEQNVIDSPFPGHYLYLLKGDPETVDALNPHEKVVHALDQPDG